MYKRNKRRLHSMNIDKISKFIHLNKALIKAGLLDIIQKDNIPEEIDYRVIKYKSELKAELKEELKEEVKEEVKEKDNSREEGQGVKASAFRFIRNNDLLERIEDIYLYSPSKESLFEFIEGELSFWIYKEKNNIDIDYKRYIIERYNLLGFVDLGGNMGIVEGLLGDTVYIVESFLRRSQVLERIHFIHWEGGYRVKCYFYDFHIYEYDYVMEYKLLLEKLGCDFYLLGVNVEYVILGVSDKDILLDQARLHLN